MKLYCNDNDMKNIFIYFTLVLDTFHKSSPVEMSTTNMCRIFCKCQQVFVKLFAYEKI